jgi:hypothetical protein
MDKDKIARVIDDAIIYCPDGNDFEIIIDNYSLIDNALYGHTDDGEEFQIPFDEIDLEKDSFFKYVKIDVDAV